MYKDILGEEKKLQKQGYKYVACLDEAGRGPLAGPVVAGAAVALRFPRKNSPLMEIRDSKKLSPKSREKFYNLIIKNKDIKWGLGVVSEKVIDEINIFEASKLAMLKALKELGRELQKNQKASVDFVVLDGNFRINTGVPQRSIIKADDKVFSCMIAAILAKVSRDKLMEKLHKKYPFYGFNLHKGYPTKFHTSRLKKYGPCKVHRKSFSPVAEVIKNQEKG